MSKNKQSSIDFLLKELEEIGVLNIKNCDWSDEVDVKKAIEQAKAMRQEEIHQSYCDGYEFALINECAEKSTSEASSYSDGYKNGWEDCKTEINKKAIEIINSVKKQDNEQQ